jgi:hypothetical protein
MATIKSFTDLKQSKKLAEILPIESADMCYLTDITFGGKCRLLPKDDFACEDSLSNLHCWSLAALLSVLPDSIYDNTNEFSQLEFSKRSVAYHDINDGIKVGSIKDNLVDACYEMIIKLHELNLL